MKLILSALAASALCLGAIAQSPRNPPAQPTADAQLYRNPTFNFRYRIPYGWVDRTKEMQEGNDAAKGEVLLAVFERPPQAAGDTVNSAVIIAAEKASPGLKKPENYLGTLTETATAPGFKPEGDPSEMEIDSQRLVRADFSKAMTDKLTMHQSTLVLLAKGQIVSFTFIAVSHEDVEQPLEDLNFTAKVGPARR